MTVVVDDGPDDMETFLARAENGAKKLRELTEKIQYRQDIIVRGDQEYWGVWLEANESLTLNYYIMPMISAVFSRPGIELLPVEDFACAAQNGDHPGCVEYEESRGVAEEFLQDMITRWELRRNRILLQEMERLCG